MNRRTLLRSVFAGAALAAGASMGLLPKRKGGGIKPQEVVFAPMKTTTLNAVLLYDNASGWLLARHDLRYPITLMGCDSFGSGDTYTLSFDGLDGEYRLEPAP